MSSTFLVFVKYVMNCCVPWYDARLAVPVFSMMGNMRQYFSRFFYVMSGFYKVRVSSAVKSFSENRIDESFQDSR